MAAITELPSNTLEKISSPHPKLNHEKLIGDLRSGFRVTDQDGTSTQISITQNGKDFFEIRSNFNHSGAFPHRILELRRRRKIGSEKGTATKERFVVTRVDSLHYVCSYYINQKKGGKLSEEEFFEIYNNSTFNPSITSEFQNLLSQKPEGV